MILTICIIGAVVCGGIAGLCLKVIGNVVDDCYHDLVDDFKGMFKK